MTCRLRRQKEGISTIGGALRAGCGGGIETSTWVWSWRFGGPADAEAGRELACGRIRKKPAISVRGPSCLETKFVRTTNRCPLGERPPPAQRRRRAARLVVRTEDHGVVRDVVFVWGGAGLSWGPQGAFPSGAHVFHSIHGFRRLSNPGRKKSCGERMTGLEKKRFRGTPVGEAEEGVKKKVVGFPFGGGSKEGERKLFGGVEERSLRLNVRQCGEG